MNISIFVQCLIGFTILHAGTLTWTKLRFAEPCPSPRSYHACVAVPSFLFKSPKDKLVSQSEPDFRSNENGKPSTSNVRPRTSLGNSDDLSRSPRNVERGLHLFKNKINPAADSSMRRHSGGPRETKENTQSSDNTQDATDGHELGRSEAVSTNQNNRIATDCQNGDAGWKSALSSPKLQDTKVSELQNSELRYTHGNNDVPERQEIQRLVSIDDDASNNTNDDTQPLTTANNISAKSVTSLKHELRVGCVYRTSSGGFENPLFSRESSADCLEPSPPSKRSRRSVDALDYTSVDTLDHTPALSTSLSTEAVHAVPNRSRATSSREQTVIPGVVKSGSLDSLLSGLGGVQITYIQIDNNNTNELPPYQSQSRGPDVNPGGSDVNNLTLEDIEGFDATELEQEHQRSYTSPLSNVDQVSNRFAMSTSGQFQSSQDQLLRMDSEDGLEMTQISINRNPENNRERLDLLDRNDRSIGDGLRLEFQNFSSDFMTMDEGSSPSGQTFELSSMDPSKLTTQQIKVKTDTLRISEVNRSPFMRIGTPSYHETVADVDDHPVGMTMILCGGKEANIATCEIVPMPMWTLKRYKS